MQARSNWLSQYLGNGDCLYFGVLTQEHMYINYYLTENIKSKRVNFFPMLHISFYDHWFTLSLFFVDKILD